MRETKTNILGVIGITDLARNENPEIGEYIKHCIDDDFNLLVLLKNNGKINMSLELAQDFERDAVNINQFRIIQVANSFQKIK
jgi:hypothetical protein